MNDPTNSETFLVTKEHRRFVEFCHACRKYRYIGLCYGRAGVGKTQSARFYAQWDHIEALSQLRLDGLPPSPDIMDCRTAFYTPAVANTAGRIEKEVRLVRLTLSNLLSDMEHILKGDEDYRLSWNTPDITELLIVDEADRLKTAGLEQIRDTYDRSNIGLVLIGMPGIEKRLSRYAQLYSRVGFVHHFKPLGAQEIEFVLEHKWQQLGLTFNPNDFTDTEAKGAIIRITGGNFRLLHRLFTQIERIMKINEVNLITKEVVEAARDFLVIGPS
jgi:DNA transposition AAA+ family ATPase